MERKNIMTRGVIWDCEWMITDDQSLIIRPLKGDVGHLSSPSLEWPWRGKNFKRVLTKGHIVLRNVVANMFSECRQLEDITSLKDWDAGSVRNMMHMFRECHALKDISALAAWEMDGLSTISGAFSGCWRLSDLSPLKNWNTQRLNGTTDAFRDCMYLKDVSPLASWNMKWVSNISGMFRDCTSLEDVSSLAGWDTSYIKCMSETFRGCAALTNIAGLDTWDIRNVENMDLMFTDCNSLETRGELLDKWRQRNSRALNGVKVVSDDRVIIDSDSPMVCPGEGSFTGWTKDGEDKIIKLLIPAEARRSSALDGKCKCDKAVIQEIMDKDGRPAETAQFVCGSRFIYHVGETVDVPYFCEDRFAEFGDAIRFYMDKADAENR